jgi:hypothetical protein
MQSETVVSGAKVKESGAKVKEEAPEAEAEMVLLDLGEQSRRRVRRLRRGEGRLMEKIEDAVADLEEQGVLTSGAQTLVVIVRQEPDSGLRGMFASDDDDDDDD